LRGRRASGYAAAAILWLSVLGLALLGPARDALLPSLVLYSASFLALLELCRGDLLDDPRVLLGGALLLRLTVLPTLSDLSDDMYRYVWDGWLTASGVNPFRFVPSDLALLRFQGSDLFQALNSPDYHTIYPPLSQLVFFLGGVAYRSAGWPAAAYAVKATFFALEATGVVFLYGAVRALGIRPRLLALYALNPLVLVTLTASGHSESGLVLGLGLFAYAVARRRPAWSWIGLVLAAASKGVPLLMAPLLFRRQWSDMGARRTLAASLPAVALGTALWLPFYFPGLLSALASSADLYVRLFEFNAGPYFLLEWLVSLVTGSDPGKVIGPLLQVIFLASAVVLWLRWPLRTAEDLFRGCLALLGLFLVCATTVHPWYVTWGLVFVPLTSFLRWPWIWASWAAFPTYLAYVGAPQAAVATLFWGGVAALLMVEGEAALRDRLLRLAGWRKARQVAGYVRGNRVLDLGAGEGYVAQNLGEGGRRLILADIGPFFRVPLPGIVYDGLRLPLADASVDTVLLSLALHHAGDPDLVFREALRVARARVVITESTYVWAWERRVLEIADRWANRTRGMATATAGAEKPAFRTVTAWEAAFRRQGGRVVRSRRLNRLGHRHHLFVVEKDFVVQNDRER
jgi:alpha-1,6-mannosyltransferase